MNLASQVARQSPKHKVQDKDCAFALLTWIEIWINKSCSYKQSFYSNESSHVSLFRISKERSLVLLQGRKK